MLCVVPILVFCRPYLLSSEEEEEEKRFSASISVCSLVCVCVLKLPSFLSRDMVSEQVAVEEL